MKSIYLFITRLFCGHPSLPIGSIEFVRNIYGDEINLCGGKRSQWFCNRCESYFYDKQLAREWKVQ